MKHVLIIILSLVFGWIAFLIAMQFGANETYTIIIVGMGVVIGVLFNKLMDWYDLYWHRKMLERSDFVTIKSHFNLDTETRNDGKCWGYKGYYKDYFMRLSYAFNGSRLGIYIYYKQPKLSNGKIDFNLLKKMNRTYGKKEKSWDMYSPWIRHLASSIHQLY